MVHFDRFAAPWGVPPRGGFRGGEVPYWKNMKLSIQIFHFDRFGSQISRSENFFNFLANWSKWKYVSFLAAPWGRVWGRGLVQVSKKRLSMINSSLWSIWPPLGAGWGAGAWPTEQQEILNLNGSFRPICRPLGAGFGAGKCPTGRTWKFQYNFFTSTDLAKNKIFFT
jgi:hypothetical protein